MPETIQTLLIVAGVISALSVIIGALIVGWRIIKRLDVIGEGVLGKAAVTDRSGAVIEEAVPSLQARVSSLEALMSNGNTEARLTSGESRLSSLEAWRETHTREATDVATRLLDHITNHADGK